MTVSMLRRCFRCGEYKSFLNPRSSSLPLSLSPSYMSLIPKKRVKASTRGRRAARRPLTLPGPHHTAVGGAGLAPLAQIKLDCTGRPHAITLTDEQLDEEQCGLLLVANRKACVTGWVLLVGVNHRGQMLPARGRCKAAEVTIPLFEGRLEAMCGEYAMQNGDRWNDA